MKRSFPLSLKLIIICLSAVFLVSAFCDACLKADAASSYSGTIKTEAGIRSAFPESYQSSLIALKKAHPNWNFVAFYTGVSWPEIFTEENELYPGRNLVYHTDEKDSSYYKPSSWYSTKITGSFNWAANAWTAYDSGEWYQASEEAIAYCMDPRNFLTETQIFQFLDSASSIDKKSARAAVSYMLSSTGVDFWLKSGEEAGLYDRIDYEENPEYTAWIEENGNPVVFGDVNEDGEWDVFDIASMGGYILGKRSFSDREFDAADINGDGEVDVFDIVLIGSYILGNRDSVPQRENTAATDAPDETIPVYHYLDYTEAICQAAEEAGINQITAAGRILSEHGTATSRLISGDYAFKLSDGTKIPGGYYNYFDIGASGNSLSAIYTNGLREAYSEGWDTRYKAIAGGALKYKTLYMNRGQNTPYAQKFNLDSSTDRVFWGQYMQNITAPQTEAASLYKAYKAAGVLNSSLTFIIPVISDLPSSSPYPDKDGNPNYKMSYIWAVDRDAVTSGKYSTEELLKMNYLTDFSTDKTSYEFTVPYECENIHFYTGAYASTSKISLRNDYEEDPGPFDEFEGGSSSSYYLLPVGLATITVTCTAENGDERVYTFTITREGPSEETDASSEDIEEMEEQAGTEDAEELPGREEGM